jgi:hypothetical protein
MFSLNRVYEAMEELHDHDWKADLTTALRRITLRKPPAGPVRIERARVLHVDGQILVLEFEVPVDGFLLPEDGTKIRVSFDDGDKGTARVQGRDSTEPGPHEAGITVRIALRLEGHLCWHHREATIHWPCRIRLRGKEIEAGDVELHLFIEPGH